MMNTMTWQKASPYGSEYKNLLKFFTARPTYLVDCGVYRETVRGVYYFFQKDGKIVERYLPFKELHGRPIKKTLTELAV